MPGRNSKRLNWKEIWQQFDERFDEESSIDICSECGHVASEEPDWIRQKQIIEEVIETQLRNL